VAGGTGTIGMGIVYKFLEQGGNVIVPSRSKSNIENLKKMIPASFHKQLHTMVEDVSTLDGAVNVSKYITKTFGDDGLHHFISAIGSIWSKKVVSAMSPKEFMETYASLTGPHHVLMYVFVPILSASKSRAPSYTFITIAAGEHVTSSESAMSTIGAMGVFGLSMALRAEMEQSQNKIRVNEVRIRNLVVRHDKLLSMAAVGASRIVSNHVLGEFVTNITKSVFRNVVFHNSLDKPSEFVQLSETTKSK